MANWLAIIAGVVSIFGYPPYITAIAANNRAVQARFTQLRARHVFAKFVICAEPASPDITAWGAWQIEYLVLFLAIISATGTGSNLYLPGLQLAGVTATTAATLFFSKVCTPRQLWASLPVSRKGTLVIVMAGMASWPLVNSSLAIIILLGAEAIGASLTAVNAFKTPSNEPLAFWWLVLAGGGIGAVAVWLQASSNWQDYLYATAIAAFALSIIAASFAGTIKAARRGSALSPV